MKTALVLVIAALCAFPTLGEAKTLSNQQNYLQQDRSRTLGFVEWRLRRNLLDYCRDKVAVLGFSSQLADQGLSRGRASIDSTSDRAIISNVFEDGPTQKAGLRTGDQITAIGQTSVSQVISYLQDPSEIDDEIKWRVAQRPVGATIEVSFVRNGISGSVSVKLEAACAPRIYIDRTRKFRASTDGKNISISSGLINFTENEHELALIAGHEMAHILVDKGKKVSLFGNREIEDRADVLGAALAKCAGFDMHQAANFWNRFKRRDRLGWLRSPTHRSSAAREAQLYKALPILECPDIRKFSDDSSVR